MSEANSRVCDKTHNIVTVISGHQKLETQWLVFDTVVIPRILCEHIIWIPSQWNAGTFVNQCVH